MDTLINEKLIVISAIDNIEDLIDTNNIVISEASADKYNLCLNDEIIITTQYGDVTLTVAGIAENKGLFLQEDSRILIFSSSETISKITGAESLIRANYISCGYLEKDTIEEFERKNNEFTITPLVDNNAIESELQAVNYLLSIVLFAVVILVFYLNRCIIKIIIAKKMSVIGVFRSIGATKGQMNTILLLENILYGLLGGVIGVALGKLIQEPLLGIFGKYGAVEGLEIEYSSNMIYILFSILFVVFLQIFSSITEILSVNKKSIITLLFDTISNKLKFSMKTIYLGIVLIGISFGLYKINSTYKILYSSISFISASIEQQFKNITKTFEGEIQLSNLVNQQQEYEGLLELPEVQNMNFIYYNFGNYEVNKEALSMGIFGFDKEMLGIEDLSGKMGTLSEDEALVDEFYGMRIGIGVGDILKIKGSNNVKLEVQVVGYVNSSTFTFTFTSSRNVLVISEEKYRNQISKIPIGIGIKVNGDVTEAKDALNNKMVGFLLRKKEYAILYSISLSRNQLRMMAFSETVDTFLIGCLLGSGLGIALTKIMEQILFGIGEYLNVRIDFKQVAVILLCVFLLLLLVSLLLLRGILKLNVVEEIKCE